jgi:hypothetical protein
MSMADEEQNTSGAIPGLVQDFLGQLRATTERLEDLGRFGFRPPSAPGMPSLPVLPAAFSAEQMTAVADSIAAQRRSIETLKVQLSAYDEQLAVLEQMVGPLAEWSKTWANFEQQLLNMGRRPEAGK